VWENQVGTGPFMFNEYVIGSHMSYKRNPNYWGTAIIDGEEYQLPFLDEMVWPIIPDESTQIAALRTGKIDYHYLTPPAYWDTLDDVSGLQTLKFAGGGGWAIALKTSEPPFDDVDVRRAMMIGTDMKAFADLQNVGSLPLHWFPQWLGNPAVYTPLEELPAETQKLYDYNPELAKQMLADAGYPEGFKIEYYSGETVAYSRDRAALLKNIWAKIGVEVDIKVLDPVAHAEMSFDKTYTDSIDVNIGIPHPLDGITRYGESGHYFNFAQWENEKFDGMLAKAKVELDVEKRDAICKEAGVILLNDAAYIPTDPLPLGYYWWPWIKNYYAEINVQDNAIAPIMAHVWIDQELKAKMGF
jgi:peptide/nickel transport system substrate-binding protein